MLQAVNQNQVDIVMINSTSLFDNQFSNAEIREILICLRDNSRVISIFFAHNMEPVLLKKVLAMGIDIVLSSADSPEEIVHALDYISNRDSPLNYVSKSLRESLDKHDSVLTPKEWDVLNLINQGHALSEIATIKCRAMSTISTQKHNAMSKLHLKKTAIFYALCILTLYYKFHKTMMFRRFIFMILSIFLISKYSLALTLQ